MKINFTDFDLTEFIIKDGLFCGVPAKLINPNHIGTKFTQKNKMFRSSVWSMDGHLLSASFPKFTNFGENPEHFPVPTSLDDSEVINKLDGSAVIIDVINNQLSMRTRGTFSYSLMENYKDFEYCLSKHPSINDYLRRGDNDRYSLLFEITTPNMRIVLDYGNEPEFWLTGRIDKGPYSLATQDELDALAKELGVRRPDRFKFDAIADILIDVEKRDGIEGFCLYSNGGQSIHKIKCASYLAKHRFKENATLENVVDLFSSYNYPEYKEFEERLVKAFDYECFAMVRGFASQVAEAMKEVRLIESAMLAKVNSLRGKSRKDAALVIQQAYGETNRASFCFKMLDNRPLVDDDYKKLLYQSLKK